MKIYKFPLVLEGVQWVEMPINSIILAAQAQHGAICLWAQVEERNTDTENRAIEIFGTGHPMDAATNRRYLATVQTDGGNFVWHVFERL